MVHAEAAASPQLIPPIIHAISGAVGGSLALLLFFPLERARIELQKNLSRENDLCSVVLPERRYLAGRGGRWKKDESLGDSWSIESDISHTESDIFQDALVEIDDDALTLSACLRKLCERRELYRGVAPLVATLAASNFVFFYVNELLKRLFLQLSMTGKHRSSSMYRSLMASSLAGICNVLVTNPLWVANLRIVSGESKSSKLIPEMIHVARVSGVVHLWSGTGASLLLVSNPIIQFFLYEELKVLQLRSEKISFTSVQAFVTGAVAKAVATVVTYPLQVTQTVLRMQQIPIPDSDKDHPRYHPKYSGTWDCLTQVYRRGGFPGLFTGMRAKLLQTVLTAAFTFLTYEQIAAALFAAYRSVLTRHRHRLLLR